jgi:hypothetical protein
MMRRNDRVARRRYTHRIRILLLACLLLTVAAVPARGQNAPVTVVLLRTATDRGSYHYAELIHERGRLVPFDIGYIDFDNPKQYREWWVGGGFTPISTPRVSLTAEGLLARAFGEHAGGALYFQPFFLGTVRASRKVVVESVYFAYVPLNESGHGQHLLERAKVEYDFSRFKVGGGYGAYYSRSVTWQHKPFVTATVRAPLVGDVEIWLQRLNADHFTVQIRYAKVFAHE